MSELSYDEAYILYKKEFDIFEYGISNIEKLRLISLICYLTQELRKKDKNIRVIDVITKISTDIGDNNPFIRNISFLCESLLKQESGVPEILPFPIFELKSPKEIVSKIKEILNNYLPF